MARIRTRAPGRRRLLVVSSICSGKQPADDRGGRWHRPQVPCTRCGSVDPAPRPGLRTRQSARGRSPLHSACTACRRTRPTPAISRPRTGASRCPCGPDTTHRLQAAFSSSAAQSWASAARWRVTTAEAGSLVRSARPRGPDSHCSWWSGMMDLRDRLTTAQRPGISRAYARPPAAAAAPLEDPDDAISSWARVILAVDWTARIRCRPPSWAPCVTSRPFFFVGRGYVLLYLLLADFPSHPRLSAARP